MDLTREEKMELLKIAMTLMPKALSDNEAFEDWTGTDPLTIKAKERPKRVLRAIYRNVEQVYIGQIEPKTFDES